MKRGLWVPYCFTPYFPGKCLVLCVFCFFVMVIWQVSSLTTWLPYCAFDGSLGRFYRGIVRRIGGIWINHKK